MTIRSLDGRSAGKDLDGVWGEGTPAAQEGDSPAHRQEARQQNQRYGRQPGHDGAPAQGEDQNLHADEDKEHHVQDLVHELPEHIQPFDGQGGHGKPLALVANHQSRHHDRQRTRAVQGSSQGVEAGAQSQGQQDLHLILIHLTHQLDADPACREAKHQAPPHLAQEQRSHSSPIQYTVIAVPSHGHAGNDNKHNDPDAIVEQGLTGDLGLQALGGARPLENGEHGDGIRWGDQGSEHQALDPTCLKAKYGEGQVDKPPDQERGHEHANGGQATDDPLVLIETIDLYVQGTCEQEKGQQHVEQSMGEVHALEKVAGDLAQGGGGHQHPQARNHQGKDHHPYGRWQAQEAAVHPSRESGKDQHHGKKIKQLHGRGR